MMHGPINIIFLLLARQSHSGPPLRGSLITHKHTILSRPPLDQWSARHRPLPDNTQHSQQTDLYLTTHNTHNRQTSIPPAGFSASEQPQTHALDSAVSYLVQSTVASILKNGGYIHRLLHALVIKTLSLPTRYVSIFRVILTVNGNYTPTQRQNIGL